VIPVRIEHVRYVIDDGPNTQNIQIAKFGVFARPKILVGNVAPTDDGYLIVNGERFVVHTPVNAAETCEAVHESC